MADISTIARLAAGIVRNIDISASGNALVVNTLKVGTTGSNSSLTKAILDNLIALQGGGDFANGTNAHTHDGRYYTETELTARSGTPGSSLIAVERKTYANITGYSSLIADSLANYNIQALLDGVNSALGAVTSDFSDSVFRVSDNADATKKIALEASGIATGTTRTITMPNFNVNLGALTNANIDAAAAIARSKLASGTAYRLVTNDASGVMSDAAAITASRALMSDANGIPTHSAVTSTELGYVAGVTSGIQTQINNLSSSIQNFEWQPSVLDKDLTSPPGSPASGDRYLVGLVEGAAVATGAWAGQDGRIAEYVGAAWQFTDVTLGTYVGVDDETDKLYLKSSATTWTAKYFEASTASTGLVKVGFDIRLDSSAAGAGLGFSAGVLSVNVDGTSLDISGDTLQIAALGVTEAKIAAGAVTETKIGAAAVTEAKIGTGAVTTDKLGAAAVTLAKMASNSVDENKLVSTTFSATGAITGGSGTKAAVAVDNASIEISANALRVKATGVAKLFVDLTNNTGNDIPAGSVVILSQTTAGEIEVASAGAIATCESVVGVVFAEITDGNSGKVQIAGRCTPLKDSAYDLGKRVYVSTTSGSSTKTAPTAGGGTVVHLLGIAVSTGDIILNPMLVGIND